MRPFQATVSLVSHDAASLMLQCSVFPCVSNAPPPSNVMLQCSACVRACVRVYQRRPDAYALHLSGTQAILGLRC